MEDPRKLFLEQCITNLCGLGMEETSKMMSNMTEVDRFLDDPGCMLLEAIAVLEGGSLSLKLSNELSGQSGATENGTAAPNGVHFVKLKPGPLTASNFRGCLMVACRFLSHP